MKVTALRCKKCKDEIWSTHRHHLQPCKCGACFIDGGREYTRIGGNIDDYEIITLTLTKPKKYL